MSELVDSVGASVEAAAISGTASESRGKELQTCVAKSRPCERAEAKGTNRGGG